MFVDKKRVDWTQLHLEKVSDSLPDKVIANVVPYCCDKCSSHIAFKCTLTQRVIASQVQARSRRSVLC